MQCLHRGDNDPAAFCRLPLIDSEPADHGGPALVRHGDNEFWLVWHELVYRSPRTGPGVVVMHDDDSVMRHALIEEPQACQGRLVKVRVEMDERECPVLKL